MRIPLSIDAFKENWKIVYDREVNANIRQKKENERNGWPQLVKLSKTAKFVYKQKFCALFWWRCNFRLTYKETPSKRSRG